MLIGKIQAFRIRCIMLIVEILKTSTIYNFKLKIQVEIKILIIHYNHNKNL